MNGYFLILVGILVIVVLLLWYIGDFERFTATFDKTQTSSQFLQYADLGDHRTIVQSQKGNNGKTVLLLHNTPMNSNIWQPLFQTIQRINMNGTKTPNLIAYDLRGHGTAWLPVDDKYNDYDVKNTAWTMDQYVQDCKKIYDTVINKGKIIICGFGFGGIVGQKFALTYPELIDSLAILQTTIRPLPHVRDKVEYLSGPNGWIAKNPNVWYLTSEEKFIQDTLCNWFYLPASQCPGEAIADESQQPNDQDTPQYNLASKMWRQASSTTTLQAFKLLLGTDLTADWKSAQNLPFKVHILAARDDPTAPPDEMTRTYTDIYNTNRSMIVALDIVDGRHGFTIMRPDYIAGIICKECTTF